MTTGERDRLEVRYDRGDGVIEQGRVYFAEPPGTLAKAEEAIRMHFPRAHSFELRPLAWPFAAAPPAEPGCGEWCGSSRCIRRCMGKDG